MAATRTLQPVADSKTEDKAKPEVTKAKPVTEAEKEQGVLVRRKVRVTSHIIERIDGEKNKLGTEGGRWIIRVVDTGKVHRFKTYGEMVKAGRTL